LFRKIDQTRLHLAITVDVKFDSRHSLVQFLEGAYRNVEPLMPLKPTWKKDDLLVLPCSTRPWLKDSGVDVIDENGAIIFTCSGSIFFQPQMVGKNNVVREARAEFFNQF